MDVQASDDARSYDIRPLPALPISSRLTSITTKPVVPALPNPADLWLDAQLIMDHYTRLQILKRANGFCLPDTSCMISEMRENRTPENATDVTHKVLTVSEFLAISLVRLPSIDVVAVGIDQVSTERIKVTIARNESTPQDANQANTLRKLFTDHFINNRSQKRPFRQEYFRTILNWGSQRYEHRLTILNHPESGHQGPKSAARASKLLTIEKVMSRFSEISTDTDKIQQVRSIYGRYMALHKAMKTASIPRTSGILRGDISLLRQAQRTNRSLLSVAHAYLASIKSSIGQFYKERRLGDNHDVDKIISTTLLADVLGTSRIFEDLLELTGEWLPATRFHFCRSLRKVGVYCYGTGLLYDSMTACRGRKIKEIVVEVLRSPPRVEVACRPDWYEYLRREARKLGYKELTVSKAMLESGTDLRRYEPRPFATLHAELNLALHRKSIVKLTGGEIGVSKSCCATCTQGLSALRKMGCNYTVKSGHAKPYVAQLTEFLEVDRAIVDRIKTDFEMWIRSITIAPDSDVSDHETADPDSGDEEELENVAIPSLGYVDEDIREQISDRRY